MSNYEEEAVIVEGEEEGGGGGEGKKTVTDGRRKSRNDKDKEPPEGISISWMLLVFSWRGPSRNEPLKHVLKHLFTLLPSK